MPKEPWLKTQAAAARQRASELQDRSVRSRAASDALLNAAAASRTSTTALPRCPACAHDETKPALRTDLVQYYRCPRCGFVWSRPHNGRGFRVEDRLSAR
jgi:transposase-like protein